MDKKQDKLKGNFGLLGKDISYSFSRSYFNEKFDEIGLPYTYVNFDLQNISQLKMVLSQEKHLMGMNVTIPYKEAVIPYLNQLNDHAKIIGAVNTIKILDNKELIGYNTDYLGFKLSIEPHLKADHKKALILGSGGASKGIAYALTLLGIEYDFVSRSIKSGNSLTYDNLDKNIMLEYQIIINCTPIGTHPKIDESPNIPYEFMNSGYICYDLVYNPQMTKFMSLSKMKGAVVINGLEMLKIQAEEAWKIWNS